MNAQNFLKWLFVLAFGCATGNGTNKTESGSLGVKPASSTIIRLCNDSTFFSNNAAWDSIRQWEITNETDSTISYFNGQTVSKTVTFQQGMTLFPGQTAVVEVGWLVSSDSYSEMAAPETTEHDWDTTPPR